MHVRGQAASFISPSLFGLLRQPRHVPSPLPHPVADTRCLAWPRRLRGSDLLNQLGLDRRFVLYFHTMLTWQPGSKAASMPGAAPSSSSALSNGSGMGAIHAKADVQVWTEVVGMFQAIPRPILEARPAAGALLS